MNTSIPIKQLHAALETIRKTVPVTPQTSLFLEAMRDQLFLSVTDNIVGTTVALDTSIQEQGSALIPFAKFADYVSLCTAEQGTLYTEDRLLKFHVGRARASFSRYDSDEYTIALTSRSAGMRQIFALDAALFRSVVDDVAFAASKGAAAVGREFLGCVLFKPLAHGESGLDIIASDDGIMAHRTLELHHRMEEQILLPAGALKHFAATVRAADALVTCFLSENGNVAVLSTGKVDFFMLLMQSRYPMFNNIYPRTPTFRMVVPTQTLLEVLERAALYHDFRVVLTCEQSVVVSASSEMGEYNDVVGAVIEAQELLHIAMPIKSMIGVLRHIGTDETVVSCAPGTKSPALIFTPIDGRVSYPIMPLMR